MLCIQKKPSKLDPTKFPGAKSRYDDFVVVHMNQTLSIHSTVRRPIAECLDRPLTPPTGKLPLVAPLLHLGL